MRTNIFLVVLAFFSVSSSSTRAANITPEELQAIDDRGKAELGAFNYEAALTIFRDGLELATKSNAGHFIAVFSNNVGITLHSLGRDDEAESSLNDALRTYRSLHDRLGEALALTNLADIDIDFGRFEDSLEKCRRVQDTYHELKSPLEVSGTACVGTALYYLGRYNEAMQMHKRALAMDRAAGQAENEANDLTQIAMVETLLGQYDDALHDLTNARRSFQNLHDPYGDGTALANIGNVYLALGRKGDAYAAYKEALEMAQRLHTLRGQAGLLSNMSVIVRDQGDLKTSLDLEQKAYADYLELKDAYGQAAALGNIGIVQKELGQIEPALESQKRALAISQHIHDLESEASDYSNIGITLVAAGRFKESIEPLTQSVEIYRKTGETNAWISQGELGYAQGKLGQIQDALANFDAAISLIESVRGSITQQTNRMSFVQDKLYVYNEYIDFLLELDQRYPGQGYDRRALEIFERKQSRTFLEQIGQSGATRFSGIPGDVLQHESSLEHAKKKAQADITRARSLPTPDLAHIAELEKELRSTEAQQGTLMAQIKSAYPEYYALKYPTPAAVDVVQAALNPREAILVYDVTQTSTTLWIIGPGRAFSVFPLREGQATVAKYVSDFSEGPNHVLTAIENNRDVEAIARGTLNDFAETSYGVYQWLFPEKARKLLSQAELLYVVPTGPLYDLPFEALVTQQPKPGLRPHYLVEDRAVAYLSSASLLTVLRQTRERRRASPPNPLVAFADPDFDTTTHVNTDEVTNTMGVLRTHAYGQLLGGSFVSLPETRQLATTVSQILESPADTNPLWLGGQASRENILRLSDTQKLADYRYVMFATHAVLPNEVDGVTQPALVLAHPDRDGFLTMGDVFSLTLNADFVALSACNTGRGAHVTGEGVVGLTRAFMYAGTPSVSVTLWPVEVGSTSKLTIRLFRHLREGDSLAEALRSAKLDILSDSDSAAQNPYFWAPVVLFGLGQERENSGGHAITPSN